MIPDRELFSGCAARALRDSPVFSLDRILHGREVGRSLPVRRGFTLIEVVIAIVIVGVLAALGFASMSSDLPRYRLIRTSRELRSDLMHLRNLAIQSNRETRLRLSASGGDCADVEVGGGAWALEIGNRASGSTRWDILPEDAASDGIDDHQGEGLRDIGPDGNRRARHVCLRDWGVLGGPGVGNADSVVFSPRGWVANPGTDFAGSGAIELHLVNQEAARRGVDDAVALRIARTGLVRFETTLGLGDDGPAWGTASASTLP